MRGIWRRASDRPRWMVETLVGIVMLPLSVLPIWLYMTKTDDGFLMYLRGRYTILPPSTPSLDPRTERFASSEASTRTHGVPVLVYHGIGRATSELVPDRYVVSRTHFAQQMWALRLAGFSPITTTQLADYLRTGSKRALPRKPILITFDDGRTDAMLQADPILRDTGMKATMFVIGEAASGVSFYYESWKHLRTYAANGRWELANHTYGLHRRFDDVKGREPVSAFVSPRPNEPIAAFEARIGADLAENQLMLRERGDVVSSAFSYPYGDWGQHARRRGVVDAVQRALRKHVSVAFDQDGQSGWRFALPRDDLMHVHRLEVQDQSASQLLERLAAAGRLTDTVFAERGLGVPYRPRLLAAAAARRCPAPARSAVSSGAPSAKVVALTFDGGPSVYTPQVLEVLERNDARGTFFVTGANIAGHERLLWRMVLGGSEIGNGTWTQSPSVAESVTRLRAELRRTSAAVTAAARVRPCFARPPYRRDVATNVAVSGRLGMSTALWSVDPRDYASNRPGEIAARALAGARPGAVIVLHDGGSNRWATVQALEPILRGLARRGYRTVTMSELERSR